MVVETAKGDLGQQGVVQGHLNLCNNEGKPEQE